MKYRVLTASLLSAILSACGATLPMSFEQSIGVRYAVNSVRAVHKDVYAELSARNEAVAVVAVTEGEPRFGVGATESTAITRLISEEPLESGTTCAVYYRDDIALAPILVSCDELRRRAATQGQIVQLKREIVSLQNRLERYNDEREGEIGELADRISEVQSVLQSGAVMTDDVLDQINRQLEAIRSRIEFGLPNYD